MLAPLLEADSHDLLQYGVPLPFMDHPPYDFDDECLQKICSHLVSFYSIDADALSYGQIAQSRGQKAKVSLLYLPPCIQDCL